METGPVAGLLFPYAVQAIEIKRRRVNTKSGRVQTKTGYAVTSLTRQIRPDWPNSSKATGPLPCTTCET